MASMLHETEIRVGSPGTPTVKTIHRKALQGYLDRGFFRVDDSGAPVGADGKPYKLDAKGDPVIPEGEREAERASAAMIVRPPTREFEAAAKTAAKAAAARPPAPAPAPAKKEG